MSGPNEPHIPPIEDINVQVDTQEYSETSDSDQVAERLLSPGNTQPNIDTYVKLNALDLNEIEKLYENVEDKILPVTSIHQSPVLAKLKECLSVYKTVLFEKSPTAKLWIQYLEYVQILKDFIRAERTGDWNLHLITSGNMLNLFAATGHTNYAKSCRLYLQMILELPEKYPWLYNAFVNDGCHSPRRTAKYWAGLSTDLLIEQVLMRSIKSRGGLTRGRGLTESVRLQWVYSMHRCAEIHDAMTDLTDTKHRTSEQHVDLGVARVKLDCTHTTRIQQWFDEHEPFDLDEDKLRSLSSGLTASDGDGINCDATETVGAKIQKQLDNIKVDEASVKRSDQIKPLEHLYPGVKVDNHRMSVNHTMLFSRLIAIAQREEGTASYFEFELTAEPTSLFKDGAMRKPAKAQLAKALLDHVKQPDHPRQSVHVIDGGALLHRVKWQKRSKYSEIENQYTHYVNSKYGSVCVVFDGYQHPSIKDHEHRQRVGKQCANIRLIDNMEAHNNQEIFLSNENNKIQFIELVSRLLRNAGHEVYNSTGDADTAIVSHAIQFASEGREVTVVADDTDVLMLLIYHWTPNMADIYFLSEARKSSKGTNALSRISDLVKYAGNLKKEHILFIHAWGGGCDTTSATFGHGKVALLKKIESSEAIRSISSIMCDFSSTQNEVGVAGGRLFTMLYGGKQCDTLSSLRYAKFMDMVSSNRPSVVPQKLPPTGRAAYFHSLRVHLQMMIWKKLNNECMDPKRWGWEAQGNELRPIMTDLNAAPDNILKFVRCNCKLSSKNPCGANTCSCRKNGLKCVAACGDCRGEECKNCEQPCLDDDDDDDDDDDIV